MDDGVVATALVSNLCHAKPYLTYPLLSLSHRLCPPSLSRLISLCFLPNRYPKEGLCWVRLASALWPAWLVNVSKEGPRTLPKPKERASSKGKGTKEPETRVVCCYGDCRYLRLSSSDIQPFVGHGDGIDGFGEEMSYEPIDSGEGATNGLEAGSASSPSSSSRAGSPVGDAFGSASSALAAPPGVGTGAGVGVGGRGSRLRDLAVAQAESRQICPSNFMLMIAQTHTAFCTKPVLLGRLWLAQTLAAAEAAAEVAAEVAAAAAAVSRGDKKKERAATLGALNTAAEMSRAKAGSPPPAAPTNESLTLPLGEKVAVCWDADDWWSGEVIFTSPRTERMLVKYDDKGE